MQEKHRLMSFPWVWIHSLPSPFGLPLHICRNEPPSSQGFSLASRLQDSCPQGGDHSRTATLPLQHRDSVFTRAGAGKAQTAGGRVTVSPSKQQLSPCLLPPISRYLAQELGTAVSCIQGLVRPVVKESPA